eukprot:6707188-Prymnesium_polylepis.1
MARHTELTFTAVVGHLSNAVRKLAAVEMPATTPLWRGVRGELPSAFWLPDAQGLIVATDTAFMSTSRVREIPIQYMSENEPNVLWELQPMAHTAEGFHQGADSAHRRFKRHGSPRARIAHVDLGRCTHGRVCICGAAVATVSMLSQYACEQECLFPPYTMLTLDPELQRRPSPLRRPSSSDGDTNAAASLMRKSLSSLRRETGLRNEERFAQTMEEDGREFTRIPVLATFV